MSSATHGATATVYNRDAAAMAMPHGSPPATLRRVLVVGGGSAGWMAASLIHHTLAPHRVCVTLLESPAVEIIGVGEGSTPWLRGFFAQLGIEEAEWMPACHATYKTGIRFDGWSTRPGFESYFHPFASMLDNLTMTQFVHNVHARLRGAEVDAHPDRFFVATRLAEQRRAPRPDPAFPFEVWYGYHFDAVLLGRFLAGKARERGVEHVLGHVTEVLRHENGDLAGVRLREGAVVAADFFIDCTGFAALLVEKTLGSTHRGYGENLFNDAAVAMPTALDGPIRPQTVSAAMRHGWAWEIPLTHRVGNGYVYSSAHCSADAAERELRERLGLLDSPVEARHLRMRTGRLDHHWNRNALAVGLSQGFIEPLEATALLFIQRTVQQYLERVLAGRMDEAAREGFNAELNQQFEGTRDYIVSHYKTNSRQDTDYWRANAANGRLSAPLQELYRLWLSGKGLVREVSRQELGRGYPLFSWYCLLAGMGCFPPQLRPPTAAEACHDLAQIDDFLDRSAAHFPALATTLAAIPPRREGPALQVYLW
jgi:tryptophan 6-halogenase